MIRKYKLAFVASAPGFVVAVILAFFPFQPLTYFGRVWGERIPVDAVAPALPENIEVRVAPRFFVAFRAVLKSMSALRMLPEWRTNPGATTLGRTILIDRSIPITKQLIEHELIHVRQWQERGWFAVTVTAEREAEREQLAD